MVGTVARCLIETETCLGTFLDIKCRSPLVEFPFPLEVVFASGAWNISLLIHCLSRTKWRGAQVIKLYFKSPFCTSAAIMWCGGCTNKVPNMGSLHLLHLLHSTHFAATVRHVWWWCCYTLCNNDIVIHWSIMVLRNFCYAPILGKWLSSDSPVCRQTVSREWNSERKSFLLQVLVPKTVHFVRKRQPPQRILHGFPNVSLDDCSGLRCDAVVPTSGR